MPAHHRFVRDLASKAAIVAFTVLAPACAVEASAETRAPGRSTEVGEEEVGTVEQAAEVCPGEQVVHGIDVSYYQGDIDFNAVAGAGYQFAITRINHGDFMDPKFDDNWAQIKAAG